MTRAESALYTNPYFNWLESQKIQSQDTYSLRFMGAFTAPYAAGIGIAEHTSDAWRALTISVMPRSLLQWTPKDEKLASDGFIIQTLKVMAVALELLIIPFLCLCNLDRALSLHHEFDAYFSNPIAPTRDPEVGLPAQLNLASPVVVDKSSQAQSVKADSDDEVEKLKRLYRRSSMFVDQAVFEGALQDTVNDFLGYINRCSKSTHDEAKRKRISEDLIATAVPVNDRLLEVERRLQLSKSVVHAVKINELQKSAEQRLGMDCSHFLDQHLDKLKENAHLFDCRALCLLHLNWVTSTAVKRFFSSPYLENLHTIFVGHSVYFDEAVLNELSHSAVFHQLRSLGLCRCSITNHGFKRFFRSPHLFERLTHLTLDLNPTLNTPSLNARRATKSQDDMEGDYDIPEIIRMLAESPSAQNLTSLTLLGCEKVPEDVLNLLTTSPHLKLRHLNIDGEQYI